MDENIYSETAVSKFMNKNLFFGDPVLKKYYEQDELKKFRNRVNRMYSKESFEKMAYIVVTDSIRDIIYEVISELTVFLKPMGDIIVSGGEAFNVYMDRNDKVVTSDIDTKFAPRMKPDEKYFGKLQAVKLLLWNRLGEISKKINIRVRDRILEAVSIPILRSNHSCDFCGAYSKSNHFCTFGCILTKYCISLLSLFFLFARET